MDSTVWRYLAITIILFSSQVSNSKCELSETSQPPGSDTVRESFKGQLLERIKESGILTVRDDYKALKNLTYGAKCKVGLEEKAETIQASLMPLAIKILPYSLGEEFELTESLIIEIEEAMIPVREFIENIKNSSDGGICNPNNYLYCDRTVGECRCGKSVKPHGYMYTVKNGSDECRFELGSGCLPPEFAHISLKCRDDTHCVTPVENLPCETETLMLERVNYPILSRNIALHKGYICFCDHNS